MKVTKYVHSCLLIESDKLSVLIDPGRYSWESHLLDPNLLPDLTHIVLTHEHGDHYHEPALKVISKRFPHATIVTNNDLAKKVEELELPNPISGSSEDNLGVFEAPHEPTPYNDPEPLNIGVHIADKLTHPGDALDFRRSSKVLALAVSAPGWTNLNVTLKKAVELKPEKVLPIHDWHWHQKAREEEYAKIKRYLAAQKIEFIELKNGEAVEL